MQTVPYGHGGEVGRYQLSWEAPAVRCPEGLGVPEPIFGNDTDWVAIAAGDVHSLALKSNGTLWGWGGGILTDLQIVTGAGWWPITSIPTQIGTDTNWVAISAGGYQSMGLKADGTLWGWGHLVGDTPYQIGTDIDWVAVSAGRDYFLALKSDGILWTWGSNSNGQLGDGTTQNWLVPHRINDIIESLDPIIINGNAGSTNSQSVTLNLFAWDVTSGTTFMKFSNDGTTWSDAEPYATTKSWTLTPDYGIKTVSVMFQDAAGNWSSAYSASITFTDVSSVVAIASPNAGLTRNNRPLLTFMTGGSAFTVTVDGIVVNKLSGDTLDMLADGSHTLRVEASDGINTIGFAEVAFTVDTVSPAVSITSPSAGATNSKTPTLNFSSSDGVAVVRVDGIVVNKVSGDTLDALADGNHTVRIEARDAANNLGFAEVNFTVAAIAPVVVITSPSAGTTNNKTPMLTYSVNKGTVVVTVDGVIVTKVSRNTLDALTEGSHTVRVEATDVGNNTGFAEVTFMVDTIAPTVTITSPVSGVTNLDTLPLIYSISDGSVTVKVDNTVVGKVSGDTLNALTNGSHAVRVEAKDAANNTGFAEVTFTVDTSSAGNDDTNIYCMGTGTVLVGPSAFTNGISVPTSNNAVLIASPVNESTIYGPKTIVKGAMDTTVPVNGVLVVVSSTTGTVGYPAQVNGKYFAAKVQVTADTQTITAIATDQNGIQHLASVSVSPEIQSGTVDLSAAPTAGIMTLKQNGQTTLDVGLMTQASTMNPITSYKWDFDGSGTDDLTCYSHSNVNVSYEHVGLYLSQVTVTDTAGNHYKDTVIVNVVDKNEMDNIFKQIWNGMKNKAWKSRYCRFRGVFRREFKRRLSTTFHKAVAISSPNGQRHGRVSLRKGYRRPG